MSVRPDADRILQKTPDTVTEDEPDISSIEKYQHVVTQDHAHLLLRHPLLLHECPAA